MTSGWKFPLFSIVSIFLAACAHTPEQPPARVTNYREDIRQTVRDNLKEFAHCYNTHLDDLKKTGTTDGKIVLHWFTDTSGKVIVADVKSDNIKNESLNDCLLEALKQIQFPKDPSHENTVTEITYPFTFQKEDPKKQKAQGTPEPSIETK
ncbi:MAG TPA: AgmX/PglI C-terminal domain-containing protein [Bdellovibrio sp.]|uniref:AgmX/PglI C-terminal domain-containing protein n=1 Tax=Bdellovibrio sp. TaxID=28201 RepID=UPI002EF812DF